MGTFVSIASAILTFICYFGTMLLIVSIVRENARLQGIIDTYRDEVDKLSKYLTDISNRTDCENEKENEG